MKIVLAPDAFKGSLTAMEAAMVMKQAIEDILPEAREKALPMADGGEGTLDTLLMAKNGNRIHVNCLGPLGEKISTAYGIIDEKTAVIECAMIAGLTQVPSERRNPNDTTSFGIGEVILDALDKGCTSFIVGLGGSATNDGGLGMLQALGMKAWDTQGRVLGPFGKDLLKVTSLSFERLDKRLKDVEIRAASDVTNPLCGKLGATAVFGPQKGATKEQVKIYDQALDKYSDLIESLQHVHNKQVPGAGAAGGLGFACLTIGAQLSSGAKLIAETIDLEDWIQQADVVITGEGQSDEQTLYGKAPGYVAEVANTYGVPAILISGSLTGDLEALRSRFAGTFSIIQEPMTLERAMQEASELLYEQTKQTIHLMNSLK